MVIKTYLKTLFRMFKKHLTRLVSITVMVLVSIGFVSGIGSATDKIDYSMDAYYKNNCVSDFIIRGPGFTAEDIEKVESLFAGAQINAGASFDVQTDADNKRSLRLYFLDFDNWTVNKPDIIDGVAPVNAGEAFCERADDVIKGYNVGEEVQLDVSGYPLKLKISGIIQSPLTFAVGGEPSDNNDEDAQASTSTAGTKHMDCLENILYVSKEAVPFMPVTSIFVAVEDRGIFDRFSKSYKSFVRGKTAEIYGALEGVKVLTLEDNYSFTSLNYYSEKVQDIGYLLMVAFLFVTALVALSTMTRLLEEERSQIACLKTLGYGYFGIISKYLLFALIATGIGGGSAYFVGFGISHLLYFVFNYSFDMPPVSSHVAITFYVINFVLIALATLGATALAGAKMTNEKPAALLRPKPPKAGKKVILEKVPAIWNRLSFKYKSTVRNVLRYKSRFILTFVAVAVSFALIMAGLSLLDLCLFTDFGSTAIMGVAIVVVLFAGLLTASVIYTLTGISISERNREIATLMVLGYNDKEVAGYIYREIYINTGVGIVAGYPFSALVVWLVLRIIEVGTLGGLSWFIWFIAPVIVLLFTGLVTLLLRHRIVGTDMNESLKAIE